MHRILLCLTFALLFALRPFDVKAQNILQYADSIKVDGAGLWGVLSSSGSKINITAGSGNNIFFARYDTSLTRIQAPVNVATASDIPVGEGMTDHKHIRVGSDFYVTFSTSNTRNLYLVRFDSLGKRLGSKVTITENSSATNDPVLLVVNDTLNVVWGRSGFRHTYARYKRDLTFVDSLTFSSQGSPWPQLVGGQFHNNTIHLFGGDETQNHLTVYFWNKNWTQQQPWTKRLLQSDGQRWWYFATGFNYDATNQRWYVGFHEFIPGGGNDQETVFIGAWDANFNYLEHQKISGKAFFRPHMTQIGSNLFVAYDGIGQGVFLKKFRVRGTTTSNEEISTNVKHLAITAYPNPFNPTTTIQANVPAGQQYTVKVFDLMGRTIANVASGVSAGNSITVQWDATRFASGTYVLKLQSNGQESVRKVTLMK